MHWSWFIIAAIEITHRAKGYSSLAWNALEYLSLFLIVLMHEFGHSLACRQVGGTADQIVLWPLGGVAYVNPPQRPGAMLWSIAAGPLVNVALFPILTILGVASQSLDWSHPLSDAQKLVQTIWFINCALLVFNLMPVYPLDGGQILRSLLWFFLGRARSLMVASIIGFMGVAVLFALALYISSIWFIIISVFIVLNCWGGLMQAQAMLRADRMPRRREFACPSCHASPPIGAFWVCGKCKTPFDTFASFAVCPYCGTQFGATRCLDCGEMQPIGAWAQPGAFPIDLSQPIPANPPQPVSPGPPPAAPRNLPPQ
ncbi:MAG: M50 family metallopeptidase [Candidatus Sumerlaeota bacterium]|nr:M50 family metallopeptidase [Candidatus Sumerlaeota bacterium]